MVLQMFLLIIIQKIKVDSDNSLTVKKRFFLHNVIINIKSVTNNEKNNYYYKIFLEKWLYKLVKRQSHIFCHSISINGEIQREK